MSSETETEEPEEVAEEEYNDANLVTEEQILAALEENEKQRLKRWKEEAKALNRLNVFSEDLLHPETSGVFDYLVNGELFYFNIHDVPNDASVLVLGRRRTGKTFFCRWLLYNKRKVFPFGLIMTQTKFNKFWEDYVHKDSIVPGFSKEILNRIIVRQENLWKSNPHGEDPRLFVLLDDLASEAELRTDVDLKRFFYNGRHLRISIICTSQWWTSLNPGCRNNVDYIFLFGLSNKNEIEAVWEEHGGMLPKNVFKYLVNRYSTDSSCLVIYVHGQTPLERFFQYRAQQPEPFRLGCIQMWQDTAKTDRREADSADYVKDI